MYSSNFMRTISHLFTSVHKMKYKFFRSVFIVFVFITNQVTQQRTESVMSLSHSLCLCVFSLLIHYVYLELTALQDEQESEETLINDAEEKDDYDENITPRFDWEQGIIPFYVDPGSYDEIIVNRIRAAMRAIEAVSCVVFKEITKLQDRWYRPHVTIKNIKKKRECVHRPASGNPKKREKMVMVLGYDCMQLRDIIHSLMHVLGFNDEVTHPQRDMYIRILWSNIQPKYRSLFWLRGNDGPQKTMVEYDTRSIMHFHDRAYSVNGRPTIVSLIPGLVISPWDHLSQLDVMKLRLVYGHECNKRKVGSLLETCHNALQQQSDASQEDTEFSVEVITLSRTVPPELAISPVD